MEAKKVRGTMDLDQLKRMIDRGEIETVVTAFPDMYGRLMGKRITGHHFLDTVAGHGMHACNYLMACDMEMDPVPGYGFTSWDKGYGDLRCVPDLRTLRRASWLDKSALVLCHLFAEAEDQAIEVAPRQILKRQIERARTLGLVPMGAPELGSFAPTGIAWSLDNRTAGFRIVGQGDALRIESRIPGADANPYLALAASLAAGLDGIQNRMEPPASRDGNVYEDSAVPRVPGSLPEAIRAFEKSEFARKAFGDEVVEHYLHFARTEQRKFEEVVTCWERERFFERV